MNDVLRELSQINNELVQKDLLERLSELEHAQWIHWSKGIIEKMKANGLSDTEFFKKQKDEWEKLWIPYSSLTEEMKEHDKKWGRLVIKTIKEFE